MVSNHILAIPESCDCTDFWRLWQEYRNYLYRCCLKWMSGNSTEAEDALSRIMLKAWKKVQQYAGKITNYKAWLTKLAHNLCVDINRERDRGANKFENIETIGEEQKLVWTDDTPQRTLETDEKNIVICRAIENLPHRLRETFILHFYQELSYLEIAQQQDISYQNVCKRVSQARGILLIELKKYFIGENKTDTDLVVPPPTTKPVREEIFQGNQTVTPCDSETVVSVVVAEEKSDIDKSPQEDSTCVMDASDVELEIQRDSYLYIDAVLCDKQPIAILALAQIETANCGNCYLTVKKEQQWPLLGKGSG
ncbi:RNA polymerase sigma factor [Nostoc sp. CCY0012]|uniref:RNA polymerase sigma factor n=1 Tax=Nostoc sp. CCY0012 TaxID=1056123 RepID=UPI0039C624CA